MTKSTVRARFVADRGQRRRSHPIAPQRRPVRPLDDGATELVRVIEFAWTAGGAIQPVLMVERELLS